MLTRKVEPFSRAEECMFLWARSSSYNVQPSECPAYLGVSAKFSIVICYLIAIMIIRIERYPSLPP